MNNIDKHEKYMARAIKLAKRGIGYTDPNPIVGAVIVKDDEIIGEGWHEKYGELHAERNAIADCKRRGKDPAGADMYVTLEPCCHHGKTPPCTDAILENRIGRVFVGSNDPNPKVSGKSGRILKDAGVEASYGVLKEDCDALNEKFFHFISTGTPFVTFKYAMTVDGKIACATGRSKWVSCEESRREVQMMRHENGAIMVGIGTVLADDPMLNCRLEGLTSPTRVICDTKLRTPIDSNIVKTAGEYPTIIATSSYDVELDGVSKCGMFSDKDIKNEVEHNKEKLERAKALTDAGCDIIYLPLTDKAGPSNENVIDLTTLMRELGKRGISGLLLEGGGTLAWSAIAQGIVQRIVCYVAPKIFGGADAKTPVAGPGIYDPSCSPKMVLHSAMPSGDDIRLEYRVVNETKG